MSIIDFLPETGGPYTATGILLCLFINEKYVKMAASYVTTLML